MIVAEFRLHNLDLNKYNYPKRSYRLPYAVWPIDTHLVCVVPNNTENIFPTQWLLEDILIIHNQMEKKKEIAKSFDLFFIDASLEPEIQKLGGEYFIRRARIVFVDDMVHKSLNELFHYISIQKISGTTVKVVVANTDSAANDCVENIVSLLEQMEPYIPLRTIRNV